MSMLLLRLDQPAEALEMAETAILHDTNWYKGRARLGEAHSRLGRHQVASPNSLWILEGTCAMIAMY